MTAAQAVVVADNDRVRVTRWTFPGVGTATGQHHHELDYIVVPITGGTFTVADRDGTTATMTQVAGLPYLRSAGVTHDVINATATAAVFVEIELKAGLRAPEAQPSA